jgi:phenylacetate-coenzyme A ligase PaaK-like adenylate-forming protein
MREHEAAPVAGHEAMAIDAIRAAVTRVPFYAKQSLPAPEPGEPLDDALRKLPLLTRDKIRTTLPKAWLPEGRDAKAELASGALSVVETGAGDGRWRFLFDARWYRSQEREALALHPRAASALAGELGPWKDAVLWVPERGTGSCGSGDPAMEERLEGSRLHLNSRQDPTFWSDVVMTRMLDELAMHETIGLFADPFYLDVLARHAAVLGRRLDVRGFVALTRARTSASQAAAIRRVYPGAVLQIYGARSTGTLFVEGGDGLLHHPPRASHVELLRAKRATPGAADVALVVVTTLGRDVQPLVRFVTGDLVQIAPAPAAPRGSSGATPAPRPTTVPPIASVEGRLEDAIVRPDGAIVTPGAIDRALSELPLRGYQLAQLEPDAIELEVVGGPPDDAKLALEALLEGMRVEAREATSIAVEPDGKYRTSRRRVAPLAVPEAFET